MNSTVFIWIFFGAVSTVVFILILMLFKALYSITRIDNSIKELLKLVEQHERRLEEKEIKKLP